MTSDPLLIRSPTLSQKYFFLLFRYFALGKQSTLSGYIRILSTCFRDGSFFPGQKLLSMAEKKYMLQKRNSMTEINFSDRNLGQKLVSVMETLFLKILYDRSLFLGLKFYICDLNLFLSQKVFLLQ